jgi:putative tricarboxylic transport membrane protein
MAAKPPAWWRDGTLLVPLCLLLANTIYLAAAFQISTAFSQGMVDASFTPKVVAVLMYLALLFVLRDALRERRAADQAADGMHLADPLKVVALTAAYIAAFPIVGYVLTTLPYVYLLFLVFRFDERSQLKRIAYTVAITAIFYLMFAEVFGVRLPKAGGLL